MNKYLIIGLIYIFLTVNANAQIPINKDVNLGKTEIINLMKKNGFTYFKQDKDSENKFYHILFKEEISIVLYYNQYENIKEVNIILGHIQKSGSLFNKIKIMDMLKSKEWKLIKENYESEWSTFPNKYYTYKSFYIIEPGNDIVQINFFDKAPKSWLQ